MLTLYSLGASLSTQPKPQSELGPLYLCILAILLGLNCTYSFSSGQQAFLISFVPLLMALSGA